MKIGDLLIHCPNLVNVQLFGIVVSVDSSAQKATVLLQGGRREKYEIEYLRTFTAVSRP